MCKWGTYEKVWVNLHPEISCTGNEEMKEIKADKCIASIIRSLNEGGLMMRGSCCGHDKYKNVGEIELADERILIIFKGNFAKYLDGKEEIIQLLEKLNILKK